MFEQLGGKCEICGQKERLVIDHNHTTGELRGLLCYTHHAGLGMFQDSPDMLDHASRYLRTHGFTCGVKNIKRVTTTTNPKWIDHDIIVALLRDHPNESGRAVSRLYAQLMNVSETCAQSRVARIAKKLRKPQILKELHEHASPETISPL